MVMMLVMLHTNAMASIQCCYFFPEPEPLNSPKQLILSLSLDITPVTGRLLNWSPPLQIRLGRGTNWIVKMFHCMKWQKEKSFQKWLKLSAFTQNCASLCTVDLVIVYGQGFVCYITKDLCGSSCPIILPQFYHPVPTCHPWTLSNTISWISHA